MNSMISVIIPVYKVEQYLDRCVESIVNQSYSNIEIILVDDESPDLCPQLCDNWAVRDQRVKVLHKKNAGPGPARNSGLDVALGEYITFVDSDDYLALDALEVMLARIEQDQSELVVAQNVKVYPDGKQDPSAYYWLSDRKISRDEAIKMMGSTQALPVYIWGKLYRRNIFQELRFKSLKCGEDVYALPSVIEQCNTVSLVSNITYYYFQRETSIVHNKSRDQVNDSIYAALYVSRFLFDHGHIEEASRYYYSALCESYAYSKDKAIRLLIENSYNNQERELLKKKMDGLTKKSVLAARHPKLYQLYKRLFK